MKKSTLLFPLMALSALLAVACNDSVTEPPAPAPAVSDTVTNLFALKGPAVDTVYSLRADTGTASIRPRAYFDLDGKAALPATGDTSAWDISFVSTGLRVKGEYRLLSGVLFDSLKIIQDSGFSAAGAVTTPWYNYNSTTNIITPKDSTILILKTSAGKYAKVQILSYYKNNPLVPGAPADSSRRYTFRYFVQKDGSRNLAHEASPYTYFSLHTGAEVTDTSAGWDLAFRSTTVKVNGESQLLSNVEFDTLGAAPTAGYAAGATSLTWYDYNPTTHTITPKLANVLILKTRDNKYAKLQYISYYQGVPAVPNGDAHVARYYAFRYFFQTNGTTALK